MPSIPARSFTRRALCAAVAFASLPAYSQGTFPERPIRLVVPVAAGGGVDAAFRAIAPVWGEPLGQQIVIDNKPGGSQIIGTDAVAKARPDGYTLAGVGVPIAFNTALGRKLPYDPVADFAPISEVVTQPLLIVTHPSVPARTMKEMLAWARANAAPVPYSSGGPGSYAHLWWEMFRAQQGVPFQHVGYPGVAPALRDVMGGQVPMLVDAIVPTGVQVKAGKVTAMGIVRQTRSPLLPDVPTLREQGYDVADAAPFYGVIGPAGLPAAVQARLNQTLVQALRSPALKAKLEEMGFDVVGGSPEAYASKIRSEIALWSRIVKERGIKVE